MIQFSSFLAIAEVYNNEGNEAYRKKDYNNAVYFYTEGIKVNCNDEDLKAELYSNRAIAYFCLGKNFLVYLEWKSCYSCLYIWKDFRLTEFGRRTQNFRSQIPAFQDPG